MTVALPLLATPAGGRLRAAAVGAAFAAAGAALALARGEPAYAPAGPSAVAESASLLAGAVLVAAALVARAPGRGGTALLVAGGVAWLLAPWAVPNAGSALLFTAGLLAAWLAVPLAVAGALPRIAAPLRARALAGAAIAAGAVAGPLAALAQQPRDAGCVECPRNLLGLADSPATADALATAGAWGLLAAAAVLAAALATRFAIATGPARRRGGPLTAAVLLALAAAAAAAAHRATGDDSVAEPAAQALWLAQAAGLAAIAAALGWGELARRRRRDALAAVTAQVASSPAPGGLRDALARALGDPSLELGYPLGGGGTLVDADGAEVRMGGGGTLVDADGAEVRMAAGPGREQTRLTVGGRTLAVAGHRAGLLDDPALAGRARRGRRPRAGARRTDAELAARLRQVRASRAGVVAAGDAERRRLEQDLHDGAQQRLAAIALNLQLAEAGAADRERVSDAQEHLRAALDELRALAHGIFPRALAGDGLGAALEDLAEEAARPLRVEHAAPPAPAVVEATAYLVVAAVARDGAGVETAAAGDRLRAGDGRGASRRGDRATRRGGVSVATAAAGGRLLVTVEGDAPPLSPALLDRVDALGGTLEQRPGTLRLELPCES